MPQQITEVFLNESGGFLKFIDNKVEFASLGDCVEFDIDLLVDALESHANKCLAAQIDLLK